MEDFDCMWNFRAVHNEITYRSLERFKPENTLHTLYKNTVLDSPGYSQAGSFFPDWGYNCLGYNQQSEDAHWPTFIKTAVNYVREVYPKSEFHNDPHVKGLISFIISTMSHGMADVKWHSLGGLSDYFIIAMANSDFHGDMQEAHIAADTGAEFTLRHSNPLSYLNKTWKIPVDDIVEIYKRLYTNSSTPVPLKQHVQYCMAAAFAASKVDVEFGQWMFGYYGAKSPFLVEELYDYYKGGIHDMASSVSECYPQMIDAFENGIAHNHPDILCANYFNTLKSDRQPKCLHQLIKDKKERINAKIQEEYDPNTGVLTLTMPAEDDDYEEDQHAEMPIVVQPSDHQIQFQIPLQYPIFPSRCASLEEGITLTIPSWSSGVGHQTVLGNFSGVQHHFDIAISAPYYEKAGAVFVLNSTIQRSLSKNQQDLTKVTQTVLQGAEGKFGWAMTSVDFNQDGMDDLAVACPTETGGRVYIYFGQMGLGLSKEPSVQIELPFQGTVLAAVDIDQDGHRDLVIGCPLCPAKGQLQAGIVYVYNSRPTPASLLVRPDIIIENPSLNPTSYDHFGEYILLLDDLVIISAPGFSVKEKQRAGKIYAFDIHTLNVKWTMTGAKEFQQFGRVMVTNNKDILAISSPSEETNVRFKKYWQAGTVRIYDLKKMRSSYPTSRNMEYGMIKILKGQTNAGHLGQSLSMTDNNELWIGEPMSEKENGRAYKWLYNKGDQLECLQNNKGLARFGSQIGRLGNEATCITSQRYGQDTRYPGAVHFIPN
ncbi:hypothetical protein G6F57_000758 [Rhizopus arrhizus]|uniref:Phosphatidylinositol-glycan-specific phospholipase D n=1 Tax=Rhizopus oryzae TaxID=64495 RepID=A0A9P6XH44_RHIOR|nr:hypothetical protein G6F23_000260 [Rhizopus arrhizus]KAG1426847.1 hypothetical protein G6F58_001299 [Rhizopus delemar]KAG0767647.1 hypothetical protein G6F24_002605 [Rhizopus arrhizus]KAG0791126.1 hypothetical protein G6F22_006224 [Rhizopus arrhizus]KAG0795458.1 hypothetical protein G6F21_002083 [Rhizopus arrhizus]